MYRDFDIKTFLRKDSPDSEWSYYVSLVLDQKEIDTYPLHLDNWSLEEFKKQWIEGLKQLKTHNKSCIINSYYNSNPLAKEPDIVGVHMWAFF